MLAVVSFTTAAAVGHIMPALTDLSEAAQLFGLWSGHLGRADESSQSAVHVAA
jgi:hypothetical protein